MVWTPVERLGNGFDPVDAASQLVVYHKCITVGRSYRHV